MTTSPSLDFLHPYPSYAQFRVYNTLQQITMPDGQQAWVVARYNDVLSVLKDERFLVDVRNTLDAEHVAQLPPEAGGPAGRRLIMGDPPKNLRLRGLVSKAFTPRVVEQLRPRIQQIADDLLDAVEARGTMDIIEAYAFPLPLTVISEMLGVPSEDQDKFRRWSDALVSRLGAAQFDAERRAATDAFFAYLSDLIAERRNQPAADLITGLIQAEEGGDRLSEDELLWMIFFLLIAGHETTVNLVGNGMLALLQHPQQLAQLQRDPSLIKGAVEELLRYANPVQATVRFAREDVELAGQTIRRGERALVLFAAANRDETQFANADELDLKREASRHVGFGQGMHYCLGAPLARVEGEIALATLIRRFPDLHLAVEPDALEWRPGFVLRGLRHLPVAWTPQ